LLAYKIATLFALSLLVETNKRIGASMVDVFQSAIIDSVEEAKWKKVSLSEGSNPDDDELPRASDDRLLDATLEEHQGKLILDATVTPQTICYSTDLSLLNEAWEFRERVIDEVYPRTDRNRNPKAYRRKAHKAYLPIAKLRCPTGNVRRRGIKQQLQYMHCNLGHIEQLMCYWPASSKLPQWLLYRYWVIQHVHDQQWEMDQMAKEIKSTK
jgi:hypothetical protein